MTADGELHEIDWVLSENLAWALRVEGIAARHEVGVEDVADSFACLRLLLQLRSARRLPPAAGCWQGLGPDGGMEARVRDGPSRVQAQKGGANRQGGQRPAPIPDRIHRVPDLLAHPRSPPI